MSKMECNTTLPSSNEVDFVINHIKTPIGMNFKIVTNTWAFSIPHEKKVQMERSKKSDVVSFKKCVDIVFIFTWKIGLSPKFNFPCECTFQPLIFVDDNKDHIPNEYEKLNFKNIIKNYLPND